MDDTHATLLVAERDENTQALLLNGPAVDRAPATRRELVSGEGRSR